MNYLILSPTGIGMFMAPHLGLSKDVEKVYFCLLNPSIKDLGKDMNQVKGWEKFEVVFDFGKILNSVPKNNLTIVIDDVGAGELGKWLRDNGYKVVGGSPFTDKVEEERQYATDLMSRVMNVPESISFTSWKDAINYVKSQEDDVRLVFKPNDSFAPKEYTYVSKNVEDLLDTMKEFREGWHWKEDFQIQQFIKGVEVDFSGYFNGKDYLENSMLLYFENKPIMNDDVGPASGGAIAVEFARAVEGVFGDILNKLKPALQKSGYVGQISCNSMVSEEDHKPYFLEFCGRFGYPSFPMDITLIEDNDKTLHDFFQALVNQSNGKGIFPTDKIGVTISVGVPPYPMKEGVEKTRGIAVGWDEKWDEYFYPYFVMYEKNKICLSGMAGDALNITCADKNLDGAIEMLYNDYLPTMELKHAMYRTDLGKDAKRRIKSLRDWKLL